MSRTDYLGIAVVFFYIGLMYWIFWKMRSDK